MEHGAWGMEHARSEATKSRKAGGHGALNRNINDANREAIAAL